MCAERSASGPPAGRSRQGSRSERSFGELLKAARESRGISLDAISDATKISRRHLEALERGDLGALPAAPFTKGFIQACARFLGVEAGPILDSYREQDGRSGPAAEEREKRMLDELSHLAGHGKPAAMSRTARIGAATVALTIIGLAVAVALGWSWTRARARQPAPVAAAAAAATAAPPSQAESPAAPAPSAAAPSAARAASSRTRPATTPPAAVPSPPSARTAVGKTREGDARLSESAKADTPAAPIPSQDLEVVDHAVGTRVVDRQLVGRSDLFAGGTSVAFWTLVAGGHPGQVIRHTWFENGRAFMRVDLRIAGGHWRTHSRLQLPESCSARWAVEARTMDDRVLARDEFACDAAAPR